MLNILFITYKILQYSIAILYILKEDIFYSIILKILSPVFLEFPPLFWIVISEKVSELYIILSHKNLKQTKTTWTFGILSNLWSWGTTTDKEKKTNGLKL